MTGLFLFDYLWTEYADDICAGKLSNLRFADDMILLAESEEILKIIFESLEEKGEKDGLKINKKKIMLLRKATARKTPRKGTIFHGERLEVNEYQYWREW